VGDKQHPADGNRFVELFRSHGFIASDGQLILRADWEASGGKSADGTGDFALAAGRIFAANPKCAVVALSTGPFTLGAARVGRPLVAYLDDFAQITGPTAPCRRSFARLTGNALKKSAALVRDVGCVCAAENLYDAFAIAMVVEKNCLAWIGASSIGGARRISLGDSLLMRAIYKLKYSKQHK